MILVAALSWSLSCPDTVMLWAYAARAHFVCAAEWFNDQLVIETWRCSRVLPKADYEASASGGMNRFSSDIIDLGWQDACERIFVQLPNWAHASFITSRGRLPSIVPSPFQLWPPRDMHAT